MFKLFRLFFFIVGVSVILLSLISIILNDYQNTFNAHAATPDELKNYIKSKVDDEEINIPNHGRDSFGKFLWGLAGCEHSWTETGTDPTGLFHGLYQYTQATWQNVHLTMGVATPDIYNGKAQIDATIFIIQTGWGGGFNNWPGCTDGTDREWTGFTDGWPTAPPTSGDIKGLKVPWNGKGEGRTVWLDSGQPSTTANPYQFSNASSGSHSVHISLDPNDPILKVVGFSYCIWPKQKDCGAANDPGGYHLDNNRQTPKYVSEGREAVVSVDVPKGGFVDLWWHFGPKTLPPCPTSFQPGIIGHVYAADCVEQLPLPPPRPTARAVENLPNCADNLYGGDRYLGRSPNIETPFTVSGATKAELEAYANGQLFYNSLRDSSAWGNLDPANTYTLRVYFWNLAPNVNYNWRARTGNEGGWSSWVAGSFWDVPPCSPPPAPSNFRSPTGVPTCSKTAYSGLETRFDIARTTKVEAKLFADGTQTWTNVGNPWDADFGWTWFEINWGTLFPSVSYTWQVRAGNSQGWSSWVAGPKWKVPYCGVELIITSFSTNKQIYRYYESGTATVKVKNLGNKSAGSFKVKFFKSADWPPCSAPATYQATVSSLAAGAETTVNLAFQNGEGTADYHAWAHADGNCQITETDEYNNYATYDFRVDDKPDLLFSDYAGDVRVEAIKCASSGGSTCNPGEEVEMTLVLHNAGGGVVGGFSVDIFAHLQNTYEENQKLTCNNTIFTKRLTTVPPGTSSFAIGPDGTLPFITSFKAPSTPGTYTARALVDSSTSVSPAPAYCHVNESIEENNAQVADYTVVIPTTDSDNDGFSDYAEKFIGTDSNKKCGPNAWPPDFNDNGKVEIDDVSFVAYRFGAKEGALNYTKRAELASQDGVIGIDDQFAVSNKFGQACQ